jgi:hypothetical protein
MTSAKSGSEPPAVDHGGHWVRAFHAMCERYCRIAAASITLSPAVDEPSSRSREAGLRSKWAPNRGVGVSHCARVRTIVVAARRQESHLATGAAAGAAVSDDIDRAVVGAVPDEAEIADHLVVGGTAPQRMLAAEAARELRVGQLRPVALTDLVIEVEVDRTLQRPRSRRHNVKNLFRPAADNEDRR